MQWGIDMNLNLDEAEGEQPKNDVVDYLQETCL
jgi:hypothetical protein